MLVLGFQLLSYYCDCYVIIVIAAWDIKQKKKKKAKMHFWSLYFGPILDLVSKLIWLLGQFLIFKNCF